MKKIITCLCAFIVTSAFSQTFDTKRLDSLFTLLEKNDKYMGSIAISENGKTIYTKSIGFDDIATLKKSSANTKYRIGSISKTFTATLIFKAIEEKKINLNQTIDKYFPTIKNAKTITIRNLLNHRSGIYDFTTNPDYLKWNTESQSRAKMIEKITSGDIIFEPGTKFQYCNSNYVLLSFILEDIYKKPYGEILDLKIIKPLKLKNTYLGSKISLEKNESYSYTLVGKWDKSSETAISIPLGAGGIVSNPTDLNIFIESVFAGKIISATSLNQMLTMKDNYGMGIVELHPFAKKSYGHNGAIDGFRSAMEYLPEEKLAVSITSNGAMGYSNENILLCALSSYFNKPFAMPIFGNITVASEILDSYSGIYGSTQIPLKITISQKDNILIAQATGQPSFPLNASSNTVFTFDAAGIALEFNSDKKEMILKQGGKEFLFTK